MQISSIPPDQLEAFNKLQKEVIASLQGSKGGKVTSSRLKGTSHYADAQKKSVESRLRNKIAKKQA